MCFPMFNFTMVLLFNYFSSIYLVHDELKDKNFELELSWVGEITGGVHQRVPASILQEAERTAKQALQEDSDSDNEDM